MREPRARGREGRRRKRRRRSRYGILIFFLGFDMNPKVFWMEISLSFGLGFVERSLKPLNCWGYESKTPIGVK